MVKIHLSKLRTITTAFVFYINKTPLNINTLMKSSHFIRIN